MNKVVLPLLEENYIDDVFNSYELGEQVLTPPG